MLCQLALLLLLSSLQPGSLHEIDSESTAMSLYCGNWGKESGLLIEGVSSIQGHNIHKTSLSVTCCPVKREVFVSSILVEYVGFTTHPYFMGIDILLLW